MLPQESEARAHIGATHREALDSMSRTGDAVVAMFAVPHWTVSKTRGINRFTLFTVWALLAKSLKTFRAIHLLCQAGLTHDAGVLVRELFETTMAALWILQKDSPKRALMLMAHGVIRKDIMFSEAGRVKGLKRLSKKVLPTMQQMTATATSRLTTAEAQSLRRHWSGLSGGLEQVTKDLRGGWHRAYTLVYRDTSATAHVADAMSHLTVDATSDGVPAIDILPDDFNLPRVPVVASLCLLAAAQRTDTRFGIGFTDALKKVERPRPSRRSTGA